MNIIHQAAQVADILHKEQTRACGEPYINHLMRVAGAVMLMKDPPAVEITEDMIVAAWLHDVYEDTYCSASALAGPFGNPVDMMVVELTNVFTPETFPDMPRKMRKKAETERLANVSSQAQIIKLCDRIDNLRTIRAMERGFALLYCDESDYLATALTVAPALQEEIFKLTREIRAVKPIPEIPYPGYAP